MPYKYNYNKRYNYFEKNQEKRNAVKKNYKYKCIGRKNLNIKFYSFCLKIEIDNEECGHEYN